MYKTAFLSHQLVRKERKYLWHEVSKAITYSSRQLG